MRKVKGKAGWWVEVSESQLTEIESEDDLACLLPPSLPQRRGPLKTS